MDKWRNNRIGISYQNKEKDTIFMELLMMYGMKPDGELLISDVKSTSKNNFNWEETWNNWEYPKGYRRQLEMYQWLFRKNGFNVSNKGYLLYFNGLKNQPMFNQELKFEKYLISLDCDDSWVEEKIIDAVNTLNIDEIPNGSKSCDTCQYLKKMCNASQNLTTN